LTAGRHNHTANSQRPKQRRTDSCDHKPEENYASGGGKPHDTPSAQSNEYNQGQDPINGEVFGKA